MRNLSNHLYEFGSFVLNPGERTLHRGSTLVPLQPKVFDTLLVLVENCGHLIEKAEFMQAVWPEDEFVEEQNLNKNISKLRQALGNGAGGSDYIQTVPTRGYRFTAEVRVVSAERNGKLFVETGTKTSPIFENETEDESLVAGAGGPVEDAVIVSPAVGTTTAAPASLDVKPEAVVTGRLRPRTVSRRGVIVAIALLALTLGALVYVWRWRQRSFEPHPEIRSLAVLPLKSLDADENFLGLGIADAVIRRISQTGGLTVRPTSAVRRYLHTETDGLTAARELNTDAVLEGNIQRDGDRLRVSVNLLRVSDGISLWADNFDMRTSDIFTIQDTVAQQVASRLRLQLDPAPQARLNKRSTSNPIAYEYYVRGVHNLDQRRFGEEAKPQMEATIAYFKKAVEADPDYALAHAQLAYAYIWIACFIEQQAVWAERAREEINRADALDPQLAETHVARHYLRGSAYEGWQTEAALRELLLAQQLNPNVGHVELGNIYYHLGLEDLGDRAYQRALDIDPTSEHARSMIIAHYRLVRKYDEMIAAQRKFNPHANLPISAWYLMAKGRLDEAQKRLDDISTQSPNDPSLSRPKAFLSALKGDFRAAEAEIPLILTFAKPQAFNYHHLTYDIACLYALMGKSDEAVKWLRKTAAEGFPNYPMFERDSFLNRIRQAPEFVRFMDEMKGRHERFKREFA
jgi:DNA-binding winged helix-turn-helix (wHTH) protein/TolB-like protein